MWKGWPDARRPDVSDTAAINETTRNDQAVLRARAETEAARFPPLLAEAERLAATIILGDHGRRQAGMGETFWQYRRAEAGDAFSAIDWRRSARSDRLYIRQTEWEAAQSVAFWVDPSAAMAYQSNLADVSKAYRASLLALVLAIGLNRGDERFSLIGTAAGVAKTGQRQVEMIAAELSRPAGDGDYGAPPLTRFAAGSRAVFLSDFLGPRDGLISQIGQAADQGVRGCLLQVLDPAEEAFPFDGRTVFTSMSGALRYETDRARSLKSAYQARLAERQDELRDLARRTGWTFAVHHTDTPPRVPLLWLNNAIAGFRR